MCFYLTEGDLSKEIILMNMAVEKVYKWYYLKRVKDLNAKLEHLDYLENKKD